MKLSVCDTFRKISHSEERPTRKFVSKIRQLRMDNTFLDVNMNVKYIHDAIK